MFSGNLESPNFKIVRICCKTLKSNHVPKRHSQQWFDFKVLMSNQSFFKLLDSGFPQIVEKTLISYFAVPLSGWAELLKGILKLHKNEIEVCKCKELSSRFPLPRCDSPHSTHSIVPKQIINACFVVSMSSSSGHTKTNSPSDSSSSMAEAEVEEHEPILEDVSDGDTNSDDNKGRKKKKDHCNDDDDEEEQEEMKLTEYHAKNCFNSTMGGKDLR